jgi:NDP-sugar pyrophosphorylase family protein
MILPITCVVLAGGQGTRALATGERIPKVLRLIGPGEPLLSNTVNRALAVAAEVIVAIGPMRSLLGHALPKSERLTVLEDLGLGNAFALVAAACVAKYDQVLVINADTINDTSYINFIDSHLARGLGGSILLSRWQNSPNAGSYIVGTCGRVLRSLEDGTPMQHLAPPPSWRGASMGVLLFPAKELRSVSVLHTDVVERSITPAFISRQLLWAFDSGDSETLDLGTPERIARAQQLSRSAYLRRD